MLTTVLNTSAVLDASGRGDHFGGRGDGGGIVVALLGLLLLAGIITALVILFRRTRPQPSEPVSTSASAVAEDPALALLKRRLAEGEISPDEYLERASVMQQNPYGQQSQPPHAE